MDGWNYTYANTGLPFDVLAGTIPVTVTVNEADEVTGLGDGSYTQTVYSGEVYGKILDAFIKNSSIRLSVTQCGISIRSNNGYGLTFNMVSHN